MKRNVAGSSVLDSISLVIKLTGVYARVYKFKANID